MDPGGDDLELVRKLAATWHLNVPERRRLPSGCVQASRLLDAIVAELHSGGYYPPGVAPTDDFTGGLLELAPDGSCRTYWKTRISVSQVETSEVVQHEDPRDAAAVLIRTLFNDGIDGIPIDWHT